MKLPRFFRSSFFQQPLRSLFWVLGIVVLILSAVSIRMWLYGEKPSPVLVDSQSEKHSKTTVNGSPQTTVENAPATSPQEKAPLLEARRSPPSKVFRRDDRALQEKERPQVFLAEMSVEERLDFIEELSRMSYPQIIEVVMDALDSADPEIREDVLDALEFMDDDAVNMPLLKALGDANPDVVEKAMDIMDDIHSPAVLPSLAQAINHGDEDIRDEALFILEDIPDPRAVDILIEEGLLSSDEGMKEDVLDSLDFITDQEFTGYEDARQWWSVNRDTFVFD